MNALALVLRQLRHRALASALTVASVALGVALTVAVLVLRHEGAALFGQRDFGYDLVVGPKGSPLQLALSAIFHLERSTGTIPYALYERFLHDPAYRPLVAAAVPMALGDSVHGRRIVATTPIFFGLGDDGQPAPPESVVALRPDSPTRLAEGRAFRGQGLEAVIGCDVAELRVGDAFKAVHGEGDGAGEADEHDERWTVVGRLARTGTAFDRAVFIPLEAFYSIPEHAVGLRAQAALAAGTEPPANDAAAGPPPREQWRLSAILVRSRGPFWASSLLYQVNNGSEASAINPAAVMRDFFATFLAPTLRLAESMSILVTVVALMAVVVGILSTVAARSRDIAIMRALGATRRRIAGVVCLEAMCIAAIGAVIGLVAGHALGAGAVAMLANRIGDSLAIMPAPRIGEALIAAAVIAAAALIGLLPAWKAYRTDVASGLAE